MATSALIMMALVSSNNMSNMFDLNYLKTQEKSNLQQFKYKQWEYKRTRLNKRAVIYTKHHKNNYNINEYKR